MTDDERKLAESAGWKIIEPGKDSFGVSYGQLANRGHVTILASKLPHYAEDQNATLEGPALDYEI